MAHLIVDAAGASQDHALRAHTPSSTLFERARPFPWQAEGADGEAQMHALGDAASTHFEASVAECVQQRLRPGAAKPARGGVLPTPTPLVLFSGTVPCGLYQLQRTECIGCN
eukprot:1179102-Prorocentrum_minimum.AAC.4